MISLARFVIAHRWWVLAAWPLLTVSGGYAAPKAISALTYDFVLRSCQEAQDTFTTARDSAVQVYGETDQADRAAFTVLKEKFEKRGDHWIAKRDPGD